MTRRRMGGSVQTRRSSQTKHKSVHTRRSSHTKGKTVKTRQSIDTKREQKTVQQSKRQRVGTQPTDDEIHGMVQDYFSDFNISVNKGHVFLRCPESLATDPKFIHFHIAFPHMMIHYLRRCSEISGKDILQRIISIGQDLSLHTIELHDASLIGCDYPLYTMSILQHGETWYHRMGFRSPTSAKNKLQHDYLRQKMFNDFVNEMFRTHEARNSRGEKIEDRIETYLGQWYSAFPETEGHTVAEVVGMIPWKTIKCDHPHAILFRDFLSRADSMLEYNSTVTLDLRSHNQNA